MDIEVVDFRRTRLKQSFERLLPTLELLQRCSIISSFLLHFDLQLLKSCSIFKSLDYLLKSVSTYSQVIDLTLHPEIHLLERICDFRLQKLDIDHRWGILQYSSDVLVRVLADRRFFIFAEQFAECD